MPALGLLLAGCLTISPSASPGVARTPPATATASPSASPPPTATPSPTGTLQPTPTPVPHLALPAASKQTRRRVDYEIDVQIRPGESGRIVVTVTNRTDHRIRELVVRWPTALRDVVFLAPFAPSEARIVDGGPPLIQEWTKWVKGPGERGEPAGTTSLGWGPLLPNATLTIPLVANRVARGPIEFDLQLLAREALLATDSGPASTTVRLP